MLIGPEGQHIQEHGGIIVMNADGTQVQYFHDLPFIVGNTINGA